MLEIEDFDLNLVKEEEQAVLRSPLAWSHFALPIPLHNRCSFLYWHQQQLVLPLPPFFYESSD